MEAARRRCTLEWHAATAPRDGGAPNAARGRDDQRLWTRGGAPARGDKDAREIEPEEDRDPFNTRSVRKDHIDPYLPDDVKDKDLDRIARNELKTLTPENQEFVAKHLVMAARLINEDAALAHRHAESASRRGGRIGIVRESLAITAYAVGDFAECLPRYAPPTRACRCPARCRARAGASSRCSSQPTGCRCAAPNAASARSFQPTSGANPWITATGASSAERVTFTNPPFSTSTVRPSPPTTSTFDPAGTSPASNRTAAWGEVTTSSAMTRSPSSVR